MKLEKGTKDILKYILQQTGIKPIRKGNKVLLNPCPICGHRDHFFIYPKTNSYYSFSGCCKGGSLVDWLMEYEGLLLPEAMTKVHGDISPQDKAKEKEMKRLARLLNENVQAFLYTCIELYKYYKNTEQELIDAGFKRTDPFFRWVQAARRFYDRVTDEFISGNYEKQVQLMRNHKKEYFYKLKPGGVSIERV